ncbi:carboxypeptidase-like regulatory domain-containing protein [Natrialbaceae archaeon A-arb3/5]
MDDPGVEVDRQTIEEDDDDARIRFSGLAVGTPESPIEYVAVAGDENELYDSSTTTVTLYQPGQTEDSINTISLESDLEPQDIQVDGFDEDSEEFVDGAALLADGNLDNTATFAVASQTQDPGDLAADRSVNEDVEVTVTTDDPDVPQVASLVDPDTGEATDEIELTITPDSDASEADGETVWSYETFEVTAEDAHEESMTVDGDVNPLVDNTIEAVTEDVADQTYDTAEVTYVLEGEDVVHGEVRHSETGEPIEDAEVWVTYDGQTNETLEFTEETFVNDGDEAFLTTTTNEDGSYSIDGVAGTEEGTDLTLYAKYDDEEDPSEYNNIDLTDTTLADEHVAYVNEDVTVDDGGYGDNIGQTHVEFVVFPDDITFDYDLDVTLVNEDGDLVKEDEIRTGDEIEVVANVTAISQATGDEGSAMGQEVDLDLVDPDGQYSITPAAFGELADTSPDVDQQHEDGTTFANTTFVADGTNTGTANITAETWNDDGEVFSTDDGDEVNDESDQAQVEVFTAYTVTGDVVNEFNENIQNATVELRDPVSEETLYETTSGSQGSYSFTNVESGEAYNLWAEAYDEDDATVTNEISLTEDLNSPIGGADIVLEGAVPDGAVPDDDDSEDDNETDNGDEVPEVVEPYYDAEDDSVDISTALIDWQNDDFDDISSVLIEWQNRG